MAITRKVALSAIASLLDSYTAENLPTGESVAEVRDVVGVMLATISKPSTPTKADIAKREANEGIKARLVSALSEVGKVSVADLRKLPQFAELSSPKVSALLTQLVGEGRVTKSLEKRTNFYEVQG